MHFRFPISLLASSVIWASAASAQSPAGQIDAYPMKPVRVVIGLVPGGATDVQARTFAQKLSEDLGRQFIVENRPGAGELIGIQTVIGASPD